MIDAGLRGGGAGMGGGGIDRHGLDALDETVGELAQIGGGGAIVGDHGAKFGLQRSVGIAAHGGVQRAVGGIDGTAEPRRGHDDGGAMGKGGGGIGGERGDGLRQSGGGIEQVGQFHRDHVHDIETVQIGVEGQV